MSNKVTFVRYTNLIILLFLSSSCVLESYFISNLDFIITNRTSEALSLKSFYKKQLKEDVRIFLNKNRTTSKRVISFLSNTKKELDQDKLIVKDLYNDLNQIYYSIALDYSEVLAKYIATLEGKRKNKFLKKEMEKNKQILSKIERNDISSNFKIYNFLWGKLTKEQVRLFNTLQEDFKLQSQNRYEKRLAFQNELKKILSKKNLKKRRELIKNQFEKFNKSSNYKVVNKYTLSKEKIIKTIQKIVNTLTQDQKEEFIKKLKMVSRWIEKYQSTKY